MGFDQRTFEWSEKDEALKLCPEAVCRRFELGVCSVRFHYLVFRTKADADNREGAKRLGAGRRASCAWGYACRVLEREQSAKEVAGE